MKVVKTAKNTYLMKGWIKKRLWVLDDAYAIEVAVLPNPIELKGQEGKDGKVTKKTTQTKVRTK